MTPGIQPSNVKMMLRKKLAIRPVMSTASGGKTTQKKYRSAFIYSSPSLAAPEPGERGSASSCSFGVVRLARENSALCLSSVIERWVLGVERWMFSFYFRLSSVIER